MTPAAYIMAFRRYVRTATKNTAVFASIVMAQALLESADANGVPGNSALVINGRNHFRIPADPAWTGEKIKRAAHETTFAERKRAGAEFRVYRNDALSFIDHVRAMLMNKRCHRDGVFTTLSPNHQAVALQNACYSTDPQYAVKLICLMRRHNLYALDQISNDTSPPSLRSRNSNIGKQNISEPLTS